MSVDSAGWAAARLAQIERDWASAPLPAFTTALTSTEVEWLELSRRMAELIRNELHASLHRPLFSPPRHRSPACGCLVCGCLKRYCNCSCCCGKQK